jgi:hypothetical protein
LLDLRFLYFLVATAFVFGAALVQGSLSGGERDEDDYTLMRHEVALRRIWVKPPAPVKPQATAAATPAASETPKVATVASPSDKRARGTDGRGRPDVSQQLRQMLSGPALTKMLDTGDLGAGLAKAVAGIGPGGPGIAGAGIDGLALRGGPPGGGPPGTSIGIGALRTGHGPGYGPGHGWCQGADCKESHGPPIEVDQFKLTGSMDKDLIREVIHRNRAQIRYCYEQSLIGAPQLTGRVEMHFIIGGEGTVLRAEVASSTTQEPKLDGCLASRFRSWQFPKPKGGGVVDVKYPVVLQRTGSL